MSENYTIEDMIKVATEIGVQAGIDTYNKIKKESLKKKLDFRLRNITKLLENYRNLKTHCKDSIYKISDMKKAIDILSEIDDYEYSEDLYIESIKKSTERTAIIIGHIDYMLSLFRYSCEKSGLEADMRKYKIIRELYIDEPNDNELKKTVEEIAKCMSVSERQIYRGKDEAMQELSVLLFGVDGLKYY